MSDTFEVFWADLFSFLQQGGPAIWVIAALSVITLALILWKLWTLALLGAWAGRTATKAVDLWAAGERTTALQVANNGRGMRSRVVRRAIEVRSDVAMSEPNAREETARVAQLELGQARTGLRALELIATIAPLIGLLGTVLGMIEAFQALQDAGARADPSTLAGGIWEALLTTAAGMTVAIPAAAALTYYESVADRVQADIEDAATRIFTAPERSPITHLPQAAE